MHSLDRGIDEHLDKCVRPGDLARHLPVGAERRDEGADHDQPGVAHQLGDLADPADVLDAVGVGEAEVAVEPVTDIVAVEQHRVAADRQQLLFETVGDRRFAGAGQPGEPQHRAAWWPFSSARCFGPTARSCQWMLVARRSAKSITPAAAVSCVMRSIRMKPPVSRLFV